MIPEIIIVALSLASAVIITGVAQGFIWAALEAKRRRTSLKEAHDHDKETPPPWWDRDAVERIKNCDHDDVVANGSTAAPGFMCRKCGAWIDGKRL